MSTTGGLVEAAAAVHAAQQDDAAAKRRAAWGEYATLLTRNANPEPGDAERLPALMAELGVTPQRLREDLELLTNAHEFYGRHLALPAAMDKVRELREAEKEMEKRHERESRDMWAERAKARSVETMCTDARYALKQAAQRRSELFTGGDDNEPPMPLGAQPAKE